MSVNPDVVMQRDVDVLGYEIETLWGTDPATARLAILGIVGTATLTSRQNRAAYRGVGAGVDPTGYYWKGYENELDFEWEIQNENIANSFIALALGSPPNGTTGAITNWPDATNHNLRSFTVEAGYDWPNTDEFYVLLGCIVERLELEYRDSTLVGRLKARVKTVADPGSSRAVAAPALSTLAPFDAFEDATLTFANPTISDVLPETVRIIIENKLRFGRVVGQGNRGLGYCQLAGRDVFVELDTLKTSTGLEDLFYAAPDVAAGDVDITAVISKNGGAEYISAALTNCQVIGDMGWDFGDRDEEVRETLRLQAKSYSFDVKS